MKKKSEKKMAEREKERKRLDFEKNNEIVKRRNES